MWLSQTSTHAVRAAIHLAERVEAGDDAPATVATMARELGIPRNYLSKVLHRLVAAELLVSARGPRGGFRLARRPETVRLMDIVQATEPLRGDRRCLLGRPECRDSDPCAVHEQWRALADDIDAFLRQTTLGDLRLPPRSPSRTPSARRRRKASPRRA